MSQMVGPKRHGAGFGLSSLGKSPAMNHGCECLVREDVDIDAGYYLHRHKLGEGGFGKVRLATHLKTREKVAIKCMDKKKLGDDLFRVQTEIKTLKTLQHDNIAKLLQVIETSTHIFLILEYCSGGELFDYLVQKSRLSELETKTIIRDLSNALGFLHTQGFAHRDLKPENILFDENHRIKLIDFGLAANCTSNTVALTQLQTCCGSPAYAAPELLAGGSYSGPEVDVWSAGVLLYALLVGRLPFDDENISNLYRKIQTGIFHLPTFLSPGARDLISRMLTKDPTKRITVKEIIAHPWVNANPIPNNYFQVLKQSLDEETLFRCHLLFPDIALKKLRNDINKFGYITATYWILKSKPNLMLAQFNNKFRGRLSKSADCILDESKEKQDENSEAKSLELLKEKPIVLGAKHKLLNKEDDFASSPKRVTDLNSTPNKNNFDKTDMNSPNVIKSPFSPTKIPVLTNNANRTPVKRLQVGSPLVVKTPPIPPKRSKFAQVKSPLRDSNAKEHLTPNKEGFLTPLKQKIECTPKKSLFKRLLESATPSKAHQPRIITAATTKNFTSTSFDDPQECLNKLKQTLTLKGIECKQKEFSLRCSSMQNNVNLTFNLEICKFQGKCVIQRKRLRGDSWQYKKICEEILKIGSENQIQA